MHIETLKVYCDLVEMESFSLAAERNLITQSAVSQQIKALEEKFKQQLLERVRGQRKIRLTPAGEILYRECKNVLDAYDKLQALKCREGDQALKKTSEHTTNNRSGTNGNNENSANRRNYLQQITQKPISEEQTKVTLSEKSSSEPQKFDLPELMNSINKFTNDLPPMEREIFLDRFGGSPDEQILTYREISEKLQLTLENAYQKYLKIVNWLKNRLENSADDVLKKIYDDCLSAVCPLMPKFLVYLVNNDYKLFQFPVGFYIRIFGFLLPEIPILPEIKNHLITLRKEDRKLEKEIKAFLEEKHLPISLLEIFSYLMTFRTNRKTTESSFFKAIQSVQFDLMLSDKPNELYIQLKN